MNDAEPCPRIEALSALVDGELAHTEQQALQAHLLGCSACAQALAGFRGLHARLAALPPVAPAFDLVPVIDQRLAQAGASRAPTAAAPSPAPAPPGSPPAPARAARPRWWPAAAFAPAGALALAAGFWLGVALLPAAPTGALAPSRAAQMAAFSALPPGALCPVGDPCTGAPR